MRTICVVSSSRADYDLLRGVIQGVLNSESLDLQLIITGMHLDPAFGDTWKVVEADGFPIAWRVPMLDDSDDGAGVSRAIGRGVLGFTDALEDLSPDVLLLLGDRFELLCAAASALVMRIPIVHIHGGETTERAFDEAIRHSITKMSALHFVAADTYRQRVIQLGEDPNTVHVVGGLGVDAIAQTPLMTSTALEEHLGIRLLNRSLLVTFHPVTLDFNSSEDQLQELLAALEEFADTTIIMTKPNADTEGRRLIDMQAEFARQVEHAHVFASLGNPMYLSCLNAVDVVVGNSSSGLLEAPSLGTPTVNIGGRQAGRLKATSVIDCEPERFAIQQAIDLALTPDFRQRSRNTINPYGDAGASKRIIEVLERMDPSDFTFKPFYDLPVNPK